LADRVLVTGSTGFIGRNLVELLLSHKANVTCLVRKTSDIKPLKGLDVALVEGDMTQPGSLAAALDGIEVVYHLAGALEGSADKLMAVNADGTRNLLQGCAAQAKPPRVVLVSSIAAGGPSRFDQPLREYQPNTPISKYGRSKLAAEKIASGFAEQVPVSVVRPPIVFGPYDREVLRMFKLVDRGWHLVPSRRARRYSLIHAADLAQFLTRIAAEGERLPLPGQGAPGQGLYYIGHGHMPTYGELGQMIADSLGREALRVVRLPMFVTFIAALGFQILGWLGAPAGVLNLDKAREAAAGSWICSSDKAHALGFAPAASLAQRIQETSRWYQAHGWL